jgi:ubiquitin carboxyl-terminal hydrolase 10
VNQKFAQSDSVQTVEDALTHISHPLPASQSVQVGQLSSSEESQQVQIEALPPVLVLHFKRFLYDATADSTVKISKPVKFAPELEIPLGTISRLFSRPREV